MANWTDHLTPGEARTILTSPTKARFPARNERGEIITRYTALTAAERARVEAKAQ